jgi:hypothetical protein
MVRWGAKNVLRISWKLLQETCCNANFSEARWSSSARNYKSPSDLLYAPCATAKYRKNNLQLYRAGSAQHSRSQVALECGERHSGTMACQIFLQLYF